MSYHRKYYSPSQRKGSTTTLLPSSHSGSFEKYPQPVRSVSTPSIAEKFSLSPDPQSWGSPLLVNDTEPDDILHSIDPKRDFKFDSGGNIFTSRGLANLGCIALLSVGLIVLFAGYPLVTFFTKHELSSFGGFNIGGINASGQIPEMHGNWRLIDSDTPKAAYSKKSYNGRGDFQLVFSDEFNVDGRSFYPGDDPYWEAVDLHYWATNNMEWYDPSAIRTRNGHLEITLSKKETHNLHYEGAMMTTWNKFCFTGGIMEASIVLPGDTNIHGLWPAFWAMGNLGRAGYGASLEGTWPYTYDACDVGTLPNQTRNGLPVSAVQGGDPSANGALSYLPGQRLSRCTCAGESHPGPIHEDGTYVGRAAPEIDVFEAQIEETGGLVSQSSQWAPFNAGYVWFNTSDNLVIPDSTVSQLNTYIGGVLQQATSVVSHTNQDCYEIGGTGCFATYGFEYKPGFADAYISWISDGKLVWTLNAPGMAADTRVEIAARPVPQEPMYMILNLGMSENFGAVDTENLHFPTTMKVDWIRVYQPKDKLNIGCDPEAFPTRAYIDQYIEAYTNPNLTTWVDDYKQPWPKNRFLSEC